MINDNEKTKDLENNSERETFKKLDLATATSDSILDYYSNLQSVLEEIQIPFLEEIEKIKNFILEKAKEQEESMKFSSVDQKKWFTVAYKKVPKYDIKTMITENNIDKDKYIKTIKYDEAKMISDCENSDKYIKEYKVSRSFTFKDNSKKEKK